MKYSSWFGILAVGLLLAACYMPWVYVPAQKLEIAGMFASAKHNFGKPGLMNIFLASLAAVFFLIPKIWAKRTNIFVCGFNIAWSIRNYILLSKCYDGECPELKAGLYLAILASVLMLVFSFVPDVKIEEGSRS
jgi:hypothetical protein